MTTQQATETAEQQPLDTTLIERARAAAAEMESVFDTMSPTLITQTAPEWDTFLLHARSQAGLKYSRTFEPIGDNADVLNLTLTSEGARFSGCEHQQYGDYDWFDITIPWDFINPETRAAAEARILAALREEKAANDVNERKQAEHAAAQKRKADEAELAALAARLGKTISD